MVGKILPAEPQRIAIVGAEGFIGSWITRATLAARLPTTAICVNDPWRLGDIRSPLLTRLQVRAGRWWIPEEDPAIAGALAQADTIILLAYTPPADPNRDAVEQERQTNVVGAEATARLAAVHPSQLIFASSADVYGPWHEESVTEEVAPNPVSPYARAKLEAEQVVMDTADRAVCLRIGTGFGPGENGPRAIPSFIRTIARGERPVIHGNGTDIRDYVYVEDIAAAALSAAKIPSARTVVNIGSGVGRTTLEVFSAVCRTLGQQVPPRHVQTRRPASRLVINASKAAQLLGWSTRTTFEEGLKSEARWLTRYLGTTDS